MVLIGKAIHRDAVDGRAVFDTLGSRQAQHSSDVARRRPTPAFGLTSRSDVMKWRIVDAVIVQEQL